MVDDLRTDREVLLDTNTMVRELAGDSTPDEPGIEDPPVIEPEPEPEPTDIVWDTTRRIAIVTVGDYDSPVRTPVSWGTTVLGKPKVRQWDIFRDYPPEGKEKNPKRDRYILCSGEQVYVYADGSNYRKSTGKYSVVGDGGNNAWELVPGQSCMNGRLLLPGSRQLAKMKLTYLSSGLVIPRKIYLLTRMSDTQVPIIIPKEERGNLNL